MHGTAVYLTTQTDTVPSAMALNVRHNGVVHETVVLLKVLTDRAPRLHEDQRVRVEPLPAASKRVELHFGLPRSRMSPPRSQSTRT